MPWLVVLFGLMIVPLGIVSIFFIIIQPIVIGTWCTLCLIAAAAMLLQIPYSLDELVATGQFLWRAQARRSGPDSAIFFVGDTDEGGRDGRRGRFRAESRRSVVNEMLSGGVGLPWNLAVCLLIGVWLMLTRITLGSDGRHGECRPPDRRAGADRERERARRGRAAAALSQHGARRGTADHAVRLWRRLAGDRGEPVCGVALIGLSVRRGRIRNRYGTWDRLIV